VIIEVLNQLAQNLSGKSVRPKLLHQLLACPDSIEIRDHWRELRHKAERVGRDADRALNDERLLATEIVHSNIEGPTKLWASEGCVHEAILSTW
jgi:hypothetical protein